MPSLVTDGFLYGDVPFMKVGQGPPLVSVLGLTPEHEIPTGLNRRYALSHAGPLADHFTVYVVNRRRGLHVGQSMSDIAGHVADAIEQDIGEPVFLDGTSTGGSVVLQLAVDRPELVRRLVVISAAYRLGALGRQLQAEVARLIRVGEPRQAWASMMTAMLPGPLRNAALPAARLAVGSMVPDDPTDVLSTLDAEDAFNVEANLPRITAPTLVIGGEKDRFYGRELFEATAAGVPDGRVHIFPDYGHGRASMSAATTHMNLGFMLAGAPRR
jgi:pimeloyl-ACP methyl ester carboxylesterase